MNPHEEQIQSWPVSISVLTARQVIVCRVSPEPATPRPAATILLLRHGPGHRDRGLEVLMVRRGTEASFMPGVWVFPGGVVEAGESAAECAARELHEEAGIELPDGHELVEWSRWITPEVVPARFDTLFFVGLAPAHAPPVADLREVSAVDWFAPGAALEAHGAGEMQLVFPTIKTLETLLDHASAGEALDEARERTIEPILPRVVGTREDFRVVLPWEPGYEDGAGDAEGRR